jgi:hypothetical protein
MRAEIFLLIAGVWLGGLLVRWGVLWLLRQRWVHVDRWFTRLERGPAARKAADRLEGSGASEPGESSSKNPE